MYGEKSMKESQLIIIIFVVIVICKLYQIIKERTDYKKTSYFQITGNKYSEVHNDKGKAGEFLIYRKLRDYEKTGTKFLFNCYLNKDNGQTTEIDVIMIHNTGMFVLESKNYTGWIFGSEKNTNWTQTLPVGRGKPAQKNSFYNPVKQNQQHIYHLRNMIGEDIPIYSIIVFSDNCVLKDVSVTSSMAYVIQIYQLQETINAIIQYNQQYPQTYNVNKIYDTLYPCTQVSEQIKQQHIESINNHNFQRK